MDPKDKLIDREIENQVDRVIEEKHGFWNEAELNDMENDNGD